MDWGNIHEDGISTNTAESYFALLKRGIHGTFHHISKKHMPKYCDEFSFRWDNRDSNDGERTEEAVKGAEGKSLPLKDFIGNRTNRKRQRHEVRRQKNKTEIFKAYFSSPIASRRGIGSGIAGSN